MGWKHYTIQTLKALAILLGLATMGLLWCVSVLVACATMGEKGRH